MNRTERQTRLQPAAPSINHARNQQPEPPCIRCGKRKTVYPHGEREWWCRECNVIFDCEDDGDIGYSRPDRHAERKEEYAFRQHQRQQRARR